MRSRDIVEMIEDDIKDLFHRILLQQERVMCLKELIERIKENKKEEPKDALL